MELQPVKEVMITNGSALNYAARGLIGGAIRKLSCANQVPNPLGLSHSGFVINEDPFYLLTMIGHSMQEVGTMVTRDEGVPMIADIERAYYDALSSTRSHNKIMLPFVVEADGSASEVVRGVLPHVRVRPLQNRLTDYDGNIYIRPVHRSIDQPISRAFLEKHLGRQYETLSTAMELIGSVININTKPNEERTFCSELVTMFYKDAGIIPGNVLANNIIPEELSSWAGVHDILSSRAMDDIPLKIKFAV
jgi:hypothetical protein